MQKTLLRSITPLNLKYQIVMKRVKLIFFWEVWTLYYLNNRQIATFTSYQEASDYCHEHNYDIVMSSGL
jgi:hypothetical protein